jgi:hypothetical protein
MKHRTKTHRLLHALHGSGESAHDRTNSAANRMQTDQQFHS